LRVDSDGEKKLAGAREVEGANADLVETFQYGKILLRHRIPNVNLRNNANLTRGYNVLELGILINGKSNNVIIVFAIKRLLAYKFT
jgi:hypothetical protein